MDSSRFASTFLFLALGSIAHVYPASQLGLMPWAIMGYSRVCSLAIRRAQRHIVPIRFSRRRFDLFAINDSMLRNRQDWCSFNNPSVTGFSAWA